MPSCTTAHLRYIDTSCLHLLTTLCHGHVIPTMSVSFVLTPHTQHQSICQSTTKLSEARRVVSLAMVTKWEGDAIRGRWGPSAMAAKLCWTSIIVQATLARPCLLATATMCSDRIEVLLGRHMVAHVGFPVYAATVRALDELRLHHKLTRVFGRGSLCPYMGGR